MGRSSKTFVLAGATIIAALVLSATALAALLVRTPQGSGWITTLGPTGPNLLAPGATAQIAFVVTNVSRDTTALNEIDVTIPSGPGGDAETAAGAHIPGCLARWFTATVDPANAALPPQVTPGASYAGRVALTMRDSGTDQDACRGAAPAVTVLAR